MQRRSAILTVILAACAQSCAMAQSGRAALEMEAAGEVQIAPDGHVSDYRLRSKLTPAIADLVDHAVRGWEFEPVLVDGKAVVAKTEMQLRLRAEPVGVQEEFKIRVVQVNLGGSRHADRVQKPNYPEEAQHRGIGAKVLLALRLDDNGDVVEAQAYQTSLDQRARSENQAEHFRRLFEQASLVAARHWHFDQSETVNGKAVGSSVMTPIVYSLTGSGREAHDGQWNAYIAGPVHPVPWLNEKQVADNHGMDTLKDGDAMTLDSRFRLKSDVADKLL
jgi:hypothetical protein